MESYEDLYKTICRVCLSYGNKESMVCLIDKNSDDGLSCFGKAVLIFANVFIKSNDGFPQFMCQNCLKILKHAIYFKLKCESSSKRLSNLYKVHKKSGANLKETVVDYLMFKLYFPHESATNSSSKHIERRPESFTLENDYNSTSDSENIPVDTDSNIIIHKTTDYDSADEELNLLEKLVAKTSGIVSNSDDKLIRRKVIKRSKLQENQTSRKQSQSKKFYVGRKQKESLPEKFVCKICQKELANQHTYNYHMQRHNGFKFICEHCGKGFPVFVEMQMHQVARHGIGPYLQCPHCPFKAPRKHNLIEHIRLHTGERPYTCDKCGLTFRRSAIWKKHMIYHTEKTGLFIKIYLFTVRKTYGAPNIFK